MHSPQVKRLLTFVIKNIVQELPHKFPNRRWGGLYAHTRKKKDLGNWDLDFGGALCPHKKKKDLGNWEILGKYQH